MSNIMSNFKLKNKVSRNGFDLTFRNTYSAKVGELLPIMCEECLPGDKFNVKVQGFSRTEALTTPAFVRIKEYYDFIFVPYRLLWRYYDDFVTQMPNRASSNSFTTETANFNRHPYFSMVNGKTYLDLLDNRSNQDDLYDDVGFERSDQSRKLLDYLDYDVRYWRSGTVLSGMNTAFNPFPLLAYQKAYADIYRFDQWENPEPHTYNLDYLNTSSVEMTFPTTDANVPDHDIFSMRYANYAKDLYMGLLPNSQYGDVSVVNTSQADNIFVTQDTSATFLPLRGRVNGSSIMTNSEDNVNSVFNFSILALRQVEFLQKYKEVTQTAKQDYKDQIKAHWNVDVSNARSQLCEYVGGVDGVVQIDQVVNQNLSTSQSVADSTLKGIASGFGRGEIDYDVKEHGIMLCIYHAAPLLQYSGGVAPINLKTTPTDYAIPEMDRSGMQSVPSVWSTGFSIGTQTQYLSGIMGYAPRYIEYKTKVDRVHGNMESGKANEHWVAPMTGYDMYLIATQSGSFSLNYRVFKIKPSYLDKVFAVTAEGGDSTDQLKCNVDFDAKVVRNLDYDGMPY